MDIDLNHLHIQQLQQSNIADILPLVTLLNPSISKETLQSRQVEMFSYPTYTCFGCFHNDTLIGLMSCWKSTKLYSGPQIEIDNVIIDPNIRSKGIGQYFLEWIEQWCKEQGCESIELNTYVTNSKSHKFYFKHGYQILGYHFVKRL